jgi:hypothetical protein
VEITLKGEKENSELIEQARHILKKAFDSAEKKAGTSEYSQVVKAVEELYGEIDKIPGLKKLPPEYKCIKMYFMCKTYSGLYRLLLYLESDSFGKRLQNIVAAIEEEMEIKISTYSLISRLIPKYLNEILKTICKYDLVALMN